jgi:hypothetical protein
MIRRLILTWLVLALASIATLAPTPVAASAANAVVVDCTSHNKLTHGYSAAQLRNALLTMSVDVKEYTACPDIIQRALNSQQGNLAAPGGSNTSGSGGGSFLPTPLIVVLVILLLGGASFGALALRRRSATDSRG